MTTRREVLFSGISLAAAAVLSGCGANGKLPELPVNVKLPPELTTLIGDANAAISKLKGIQGSLPASAQTLVDNAATIVADLSAASSADAAKASGANLTSVLGGLVAMVPKQSGKVGTIMTAIETWLPVAAKVAGIVVPMLLARRSTGMTVEQARAVLHS